MTDPKTHLKTHPKTHLVILDDTQRVNLTQAVTAQMRIDYARRWGRSLPPDFRFLPLRDHRGRQIQKTVTAELEFEGRHLWNAVVRARRWIRSTSFKTRKAPRHILEALMAFQKADPAGFAEAVDAAA